MPKVNASSLKNNQLVNKRYLIDDIFQKIKDKRQYIIKAQWKYRKITITNQVIGFIAGILGSIAATFLLKVDLTKIILWLHNLNK